MKEIIRAIKIIKNPLKAIRKHCCQCVGSNKNVVVEVCGGEDSCYLYPFRFGTNPFRKKKELTEEHKRALKEGLNKFKMENKDEK